MFEHGLFLFTGEELKMRESYARPGAVVYEGQGPKAKHFEPRTTVNEAQDASFFDKLLNKGREVGSMLRPTHTVHATELAQALATDKQVNVAITEFKKRTKTVF